MRIHKSKLVAAAVLVLLLCGSGAATSQSCFPYPMPWPNGCSVGLPLFIQNGLDTIFWGACTQHDLCYGAPNPSYGPCRGYGWKAGCDATLAGSMEATCFFYAGILAFPGSGWIDADDFLEDCSYVTGAFYTAVTVFGFPAFETRQCCVGCNTNMCNNAGLPLPYFCTFGGSSCGSWGGGGGGPGCGGGFSATQVFTLDLESGRVRRSDPVTPGGLVRTMSFDGKTYFQEEWVLTELDGTRRSEVLRSASTRAVHQLGSGGTLLAKAGRARAGQRYLIVEAAQHIEGRVPPLVKLQSLVTGVAPSGAITDGRVTFRATFSPEGVLDGVEVIEGDPVTARTLAADLRVEFPLAHTGGAHEDHRSVVFATFEAKDGEARIISAIPILPQCCCGDEFCV